MCEQTVFCLSNSCFYFTLRLVHTQLMFKQATVLKISFIMWLDLKSSLSDETRSIPFPVFHFLSLRKLPKLKVCWWYLFISGTYSFFSNTGTFILQPLTFPLKKYIVGRQDFFRFPRKFWKGGALS